MAWLKLSGTELGQRPAAFRYAYYLVTSFKVKSFASWRDAGEPNPFVAREYSQESAERSELVSMFADMIEPRSKVSRQGLD